ncbi:flagellar hook-associated protein FlgL [Bacillus carboniphilus]|uniref:Flagellar hook-associated protein FlgL n=1 Tax=Bacillus carboniphilus TaxID=86663 RepID=A0ABY9JY39_9BACI|nr:flagellar hook-associated protein FlgL [Bacillus carboniphilus]WLR44319.1 flagellar hook-associated protein FlgL [Bacillus carboniphilus]
MRITQSMLASNSFNHISKSYDKMSSFQEQLSTGKKITRPSDDPVVAMKGMFYRTNLTEIEQFQRNLSTAYQWIENSESGIEQGSEILQRVRELVVQGSNGSNSKDDLQSIAAEVAQLKEDLIGVANTKVAGNYIFNGTNITEPPIDIYSQLVNMNENEIKVEVSSGVQMGVSANPIKAFGGENPTLFETLDEILAGLQSGNFSDGDEFLFKIDQHLESMNGERAELGAKYNRLELIENRLGQQEVIANRILSENEDVDLEEVIINMTVQESIHRASLAIGAKVIQPTLIDFLR